MTVAATQRTGQYEPLNENTPRVGSAEGAGINRSALAAKRKKQDVAVPVLSRSLRVVNRRLVA